MKNKRPFDPRMLNFAHRYPQRAKVLRLPNSKEMMIANAKSDQERRTMATIEYLRAHEKSQQEVINGWNKFLEKHLRLVLENAGEGVTEEDLDLNIGPVDPETFEGCAEIGVRGIPVLILTRGRERAGDTAAGVEMWDWCFAAKLLGDNEADTPDPGDGLE